MDPQRQHARLLGLWGPAIKAARRRAHREGAAPDTAWLALAAHCTGHGYAFQFVPGPVVQLVMLDPGPVVLVAAPEADDTRRDWRWPVYGISREGSALMLGAGHGVLRQELAGRLGRPAWAVLAAEDLTEGPPLVLDRAEDALVVLAAHAAGALSGAPRADWCEASYRWRHRAAPNPISG